MTEEEKRAKEQEIARQKRKREVAEALRTTTELSRQVQEIATRWQNLRREG